MEIKLPYSEQYAELIPREKAVEMIENMNFVETFGLAWKGFIPWAKDGICQLNLITGEFQSISLGDNETLSGADAVSVVCYRIDATEEFSPGELLDEFEIDDFEDSGLQLKEWMNREEIDYIERVKESVRNWWNDGGWDYWEQRAIAQLDEWYK